MIILKLIPEQVKSLRKRKCELLRMKEKYYDALHDREKEQFDLGVLYEDDSSYRDAILEIREIDRLLKEGEFVSDRNLSSIDVGTRFRVFYDGDMEDYEDLLLVDQLTLPRPIEFVSLESDMGRAVVGKKVGDTFSYFVEATGNIVHLTIESIDQIRSHYEHFIRERKYDRRVRKIAKREITDSIQKDLYSTQTILSPSQYELLLEEKEKLDRSSDSNPSKKGFITKMLNYPVVLPPDDDSIGIGSYITVFLTDGEREEYKSFEMIHHAVSTELESNYVEKISTLGNSIFGKRVGDSFKVVRNGEKHLKGIVVSVDNTFSSVKQISK